MSELKTAKDLEGHYRVAMQPIMERVDGIWKGLCREFILRIDAAETRIKELETENERLGKQVARFLEPLSDEEWAETKKWKPCLWRDNLDQLIAKRLEPKGESNGR